MKMHVIFTLIVLIFLTVSCQNPYRNNTSTANYSNVVASANSQKIPSVSKDAYQVTTSEYDEYFVLRYGLLYQKLSDVPFSGRIIQVDDGPSGKFVVADESWKLGKKHGITTKWFSNGSKMFERNYKEGRWHGPVTRWWPNGQRMYVTTYTDGTRNGKEVKWKSDGTPLNAVSEKSNPVSTPVTQDLETESVEPVPALNDDQSFTTDPQLEDTPASPPSVEFITEPPLPTVSDPVLPTITETPPLPETSPNEGIEPVVTDIPTIPVSNENDVVNEVDALPEMDIPGPAPLEEPPVSTDSPLSPLPVIPSVPESAENLPGLPGLPSDDTNSEELPALPGLPETESELPPMPAEDLDSLPGLPPLPGADSDTDALPPLPPLP